MKNSNEPLTPVNTIQPIENHYSSEPDLCSTEINDHIIV